MGVFLPKTPPFRGPKDEALTRIVAALRPVFDPDAVEVEVLFRPAGERYRRRFLNHRISAARPVRARRPEEDGSRRLSVPFRSADVVDGTFALLRRAHRPWTGAERLRFELLAPFLAHLLELAAEGEMERCARRRLAALAPDRVRPRLLAAGLSAREAEVVGAILRGLRNAEIARELFITEWTVKDHLKHVFQKLGVRSRGSLVRALWDETLVSRGSPC